MEVWEPMRASMVIKVAIERPFDEVYELLADPLYFGKWAVTPDTEMEALDNGDWLVELPRGQSLIRFTPPNAYGILDYEVFPLGESHGSVNPVRLVRNDEGCELVLIWYQRDGMSEDKFRSDAQWVESDLQRLKTLLEGG
jgi:hypothetical protein